MDTVRARRQVAQYRAKANAVRHEGPERAAALNVAADELEAEICSWQTRRDWSRRMIEAAWQADAAREEERETAQDRRGKEASGRAVGGELERSGDPWEAFAVGLEEGYRAKHGSTQLALEEQLDPCELLTMKASELEHAKAEHRRQQTLRRIRRRRTHGRARAPAPRPRGDCRPTHFGSTRAPRRGPARRPGGRRASGVRSGQDPGEPPGESDPEDEHLASARKPCRARAGTRCRGQR
jgi:hypothetical protein